MCLLDVFGLSQGECALYCSIFLVLNGLGHPRGVLDGCSSLCQLLDANYHGLFQDGCTREVERRNGGRKVVYATVDDSGLARFWWAIDHHVCRFGWNGLLFDQDRAHLI